MRAPRTTSLASAAGVAAAAAVLAGAGWPREAAAQPSPRSAAAAEALFQEGRALLMAGKVDEACPKLEESHRLDPATGTLMAVALCQEQQGKLASAWAAFAEIEGRSRADGRADRERTAREHGAALRPRLSTLTLQVSKEAAEAPGLAISLDGVGIGKGAWNAAIPVDGGDHVVEAEATGRRKWRLSISVKPERDYTRLVVPILLPPADLAATPPEAEGAAGARDGALDAPAAAASGDGADPGSGRRVLGLALAAVGVAGLGAATFIALDARSDYEAATADCMGGTCPPDPYGRAQDAREQGNLASLVAGAAGAVAISGAVLWLTAPGKPAAGGGARVAVHPRGLVLTGWF